MDYREFQKIINHRFSDVGLLKNALTHSSYINDRDRGGNDNERLEFLGDAVLDLVIAHHLYESCPGTREGLLSKQRASIVCERALSKRALELGMGEYMLLGKGEAMTGGRTRSSILADAFEAVIAAIYLDAGYQAAYDCAVEQLKGVIAEAKKSSVDRDYKTALQEIIQERDEHCIEYRVLSVKGPDHDCVYTVEVYNLDKPLGKGTGRNKKEAEQNAAQDALNRLERG